MKLIVVVTLSILSLDAYCGGIKDMIKDSIVKVIHGPMKMTGASSRSVRYAAKGLVATKMVKSKVRYLNKIRGKVESKIYKTIEETTGLNREHMATIIGVGTSISNGIVDTHVLRYHIKLTDGVRFRPDIRYNFNTQDISGSINLNVGW